MEGKKIEISEDNWYRLLKITAIDRHHIMQLFREVVGLKPFSFDDVLEEIAQLFEVPLEKLKDIRFAPYNE